MFIPKKAYNISNDLFYFCSLFGTVTYMFYMFRSSVHTHKLFIIRDLLKISNCARPALRTQILNLRKIALYPSVVVRSLWIALILTKFSRVWLPENQNLPLLSWSTGCSPLCNYRGCSTQYKPKIRLSHSVLRPCRYFYNACVCKKYSAWQNFVQAT